MAKRHWVNVIENVTEYQIDVISKNLGPGFEIRSARLDPRIFGVPAARARLYALAINREKVQFAPWFDLEDFIDILTSRVVMSFHSYWWMDIPRSNLSAAEELCMHLVSIQIVALLCCFQWFSPKWNFTVAWPSPQDAVLTMNISWLVSKLSLTKLWCFLPDFNICKERNLKDYEQLASHYDLCDLTQYPKNSRGRGETIDKALPTLTTNSGKLYNKASFEDCLNFVSCQVSK